MTDGEVMLNEWRNREMDGSRLAAASRTMRLLLIVLGMIMSTEVFSAERADPAPACPAKIPATWLAPEAHPRLFCTRDDVAAAQRIVQETEWGRAYLESQRRLCERFVAMSPEQLRSLVPPPGSKIVYGLGLNLDPVRGKRMRWGGWDNPFTVLDSEGKVYPNEEWPDKGDGVRDPRTGQTYYFTAQANGFIIAQLEQKILPALADVYALTGSQDHARAAAAIFDALAVTYPVNRRGPIDYPTSDSDMDRGGRLDRPYYQVARGLMNYVTAIDLLAPSGEFEKPSSAAPGMTIRENLIRNLLWDGATYCYQWTLEGYQLDNGHADYARGAAMVGILLGVREFAEPMLEGPLSLDAMLAINIDRNGFYHEVSPAYANHTRELYTTMAEMIEAARRIGWSDVPSAYANPAMQFFLNEPFNRQEVGGHMPAIGDDGPDRFEHDPMHRLPGKDYVNADRYLKSQIESAWVRLVRSPDQEDRRRAAQLLRDTYGDATPQPPADDRWSIYHITPENIEMLQKIMPDPSRFETGSTFYGAKGLALLRGGKGSQRYGAQLFFGPVHNHGQKEALTWTFFARGSEWSFDPGYYNTHYRFGWTTTTVSHQAIVVNATSYDTSAGGGYLLSWHDSPLVQWALARHPDAYREQGATRYERLIAQVHDPATGELAYWLDVGTVAGGNIRDDSMHTQMQEVSLNVALPEPRAPSLYGDKDLGRILADDGRLNGPEFADKPFYWEPPGDGYGFLGSPREVPMPDAVRATFTNPAFAKVFKGAVVADLLGAPGRKLIVANGPQTLGTPSVPYLLRRDEGEGTSVFAKVLRLLDDPGRDIIASVKALQFEGAAAGRGPSGWCITWSDGKRDVWLLGDSDRRGIYATAAADLPRIATDARIALVRLGADGRISAIHASAATHISVEGGPTLEGAGSVEGRVTKASTDRGTVTVTWSGAADALRDVRPGALLVSVPPEGQPATWRVARIEGDMVEFEDVKLALARNVEFTAMPDKPGWYALLPGVGRFFDRNSKALGRYAVGKHVYRGDRRVARIAELAPDARSARLESNGQPASLGERFTGAILEIGPGDRVIVPVERDWSPTN